MALMTNRKIALFNLEIDNVTRKEAVTLVDRLAGETDTSSRHYVVTPNVDHVVRLQRNREFSDIYAGASAVFPDGMPIIWASRLLGVPLKERVTGADLLPDVCNLSSSKGYRLFFLGGRPGVARAAGERLCNRYPPLRLVGTYSPPFGFEHDRKENNKIITMINSKKPDILFVGLGCPKQEKWIHNNIGKLGINVALCTGAAFDFVAGSMKRAPEWVQKMGLEWFHRLLSEPGRLWKRYLVDDTVFLKMVMREYFKKSKRDSD
jgi:N-acetylglucosaminyldiphosphoundecaprenol N-acetyl-beta-D-mannosaminyltransferase